MADVPIIQIENEVNKILEAKLKKWKDEIITKMNKAIEDNFTKMMLKWENKKTPAAAQVDPADGLLTKQNAVKTEADLVQLEEDLHDGNLVQRYVRLFM